jgi:hypothetical protein
MKTKMTENKEPKKLTIVYSNQFIYFEDFEKLETLEIFGILEMAKASVEVLYKIKLMENINSVMANKDEKLPF